MTEVLALMDSMDAGRAGTPSPPPEPTVTMTTAAMRAMVVKRLLKAAGTLANEDGMVTMQAGAWVSLKDIQMSRCSTVGTVEPIQLAVDWQVAWRCHKAAMRMAREKEAIELEGCAEMARLAEEHMSKLEAMTDEYLSSVAWKVSRVPPADTYRQLTEVLETFWASDVFYHKRAAPTNVLKAVSDMRRWVGEERLNKTGVEMVRETIFLKRGRSA